MGNPREIAVNKLPGGAQYVTALQNPQICFTRPTLKSAQPVRDAMGMPKPISGNSAIVLSLVCADGQRMAVKCFTRPVSDQATRYRDVTEHLNKIDKATLSQPWKIDFEYIPDGILVEGYRYPILVMEWAEGKSLTAWLDEHHEDQAAVAALACKFFDLIDDLHNLGIAHGDLQHGNLLVTDDLTLRLVDYDGMFVPLLSGQTSNEVGHRNYQSPNRSLEDFDLSVDNFSSWVIYISLIAIAADPAIWTQFHEPDGEYLLLTEDDFENPEGSAHFPGLVRHGNLEVSELMKWLEALCELPLNEVPALDDRLSRAGKNDDESRADGDGQYRNNAKSGIPDWLNEHISTRVIQEISPVVRFEEWRLEEGALALLGFLSVTLSLGTAAFLAPGFGVALIIFLLLSVTFFVGSARVHYKRAEIAALRNEQRSLEQLLGYAQEAASKYLAASKERSNILAEQERMVEVHAEQNQELTHQLHSSLARIESWRNAATEAIYSDLKLIKDDLQSALDGALMPLQQPWVEAALPTYLIADARLSTITSKDKGALARADILSAADIVGVSQTKSGSNVRILTRDGRSVKVPGIGSGKASVLRKWRLRCENEARSACSIRLPGDEETQIRYKFNDRFLEMTNREVEINEEVERRREVVRRETITARTAMADLQQGEIAELHAQLTVLDSQIASFRSVANEASEVQRSQIVLANKVSSLSYTRYLAFIFLRR
ncbi:AarF/UbiB family protein [Streptomyces sp. NPDC046876]|uniref:protein kinase domain-containing protein n=1 Tax=Streptomyces sp. NPDC046876 TaxID=3155616 RepID=UPI0033EFFDDE